MHGLYVSNFENMHGSLNAIENTPKHYINKLASIL